MFVNQMKAKTLCKNGHVLKKLNIIRQNSFFCGVLQAVFLFSVSVM